jgi:transcriptional regulator with XRE-family HTH domain
LSIRRHPVAFSQEFGDRLARVLADQRLSQQTLAERLQSSPSFVSAVVRGLKAPGAEFLVSLHDALGISVDWLLTGKGNPYGGEVDADLLQNLVLQVQLARLTADGNSTAAWLLSSAFPDLDLDLPASEPRGKEHLQFLTQLLKKNTDLAAAIAILNHKLLKVPEEQRGATAAEAISELVQTSRQPSILNVLRATTETAGADSGAAQMGWDRTAELSAVSKTPAHPEPTTRASGKAVEDLRVSNRSEAKQQISHKNLSRKSRKSSAK